MFRKRFHSVLYKHSRFEKALEKKRKREEKALEKANAKKQKIDRENKFSAISAALKSTNHTKLAVPTFKQN